MRNIHSIIRLLHGYRLRIALIIVSGIIRIGVGLIFVATSKRAVDIAIGQAEGSLSLCIGVLIIALIIELICSSVASRNTELSEASMRNDLQNQYFKHILHTTTFGRKSVHSGNMMSRLTEDCRVAAECLCRIVPTIFTATIQLIGAFLFLWYFSHVLALILLITLPLFILSGKAYYRKVRKLTQKIRDIETVLQERMQESLQHRILLITLQQTAKVINAVSDLQNTRYKLLSRRTNITVFSRTALLAGFETGYLVAFIWGLFGLSKGTVSFGLMTAYLQLAGQIQRPIAELARLIPSLIHSQTSFSRLLYIASLPAEMMLSPDAPCRGCFPFGISIRNITFAYPSNNMIFKNFSYIFPPGSLTAIMGETGSGKSTLFKLILSIIKPQDGSIELFLNREGESETITDSMANYGMITYVPQGKSLLSGSIRDNLLMGKKDATEDEMYKALHAAAADFVLTLDKGLDTRCGELGEGLSEGQAQRIAIARGLLRPGKVLLLDEISSSLDADTESLLLKRLNEMKGTHTILFVTHRTSVLPYCDNILQIG